MPSKLCSKCKEFKDWKDFRIDKTKRDNIYSSCKNCVKEVGKKYYLKAKDKMAEYQRNNPEIHRRAYKRWYLKNKKRVNEYVKQWARKNKVKSYGYTKKWRMNNMERHIHNVLNYRYRKLTNGGEFTLKDWQGLKEKVNGCANCGRKEPEIKITIDHIVPIKLGGKNNIDNLQPLCVSCNCSKGATVINYLQKYSAIRN